MTNEIATADKAQTTLARMIVAAIPGIGGSATVYLDQKIEKSKQERLATYLNDLHVRLKTVEEHLLPDDQTVEMGRLAVDQSSEAWKPSFLAAIVTSHQEGAAQFVRQALIRCARDLTEVDVCTLTSLSLDRPELAIVERFTSLRAVMTEIENESADVQLLRNASIAKLEANGLVTIQSESVKLARLGDILLEAVSS